MLKLSIIALLFMGTMSVHAQIPTSIDGLNINVDKDNPRPGENVVVLIESFSFDLSSASIVWVVDGKTQNQGIGVTKTTVRVGSVGVPVSVTAVVKTSEGREVKKSIVIKSGSVDMILEPLGYFPPFFGGKLPFTYQNKIHVVAVPHLSKDGKNEIDPKVLVYKWKLGGKYVENGQGYGKQFVDIQADEIPKPIDIEVEVYDREQTQDTVGTMTIEPIEPSLSFYEEDSLYGVLFNKALSGKVSLKNSEMKIRAVPFGFNINPKNDLNDYTWSINNIEQQDLSKNQSITIRTKGDAEGTSNINLDIRNQGSILQGARGGFSVYFNKKTTNESSGGVTF